jgi:hypothetical protein
MRIALAAASAALALGVGGATGSTPAQRIQVVADEFSFTLSRAALRPGPAIVELVNYGEDVHDLRLRRQARGAVTVSFPAVQPGGAARKRIDLTAGSYLLWCSIGDHRHLGMWATLRVAAQPPR